MNVNSLDLNKKRKSIWPLPGGTDNFVESLKQMLQFILKRKPLLDEFNSFIKSTFPKVNSDQVIASYTNVLTGIGLAQKQGSYIVLTSEGEQWLKDGSSELLFSIIDSKVILIQDLLKYLVNPITLEDLFKEVKQDYPSIEWDTSTQLNFRMYWLKSLGLIDSSSNGIVLTEVGRKLLNDNPILDNTQRIIKQKAEQFLQQLDNSWHQDRLQQINDFQQRFPKVRLLTLEPNELWAKGNPDTFFNWVENKTPGKINVYATVYQGFLENLATLRSAFTILIDDNLTIAQKFKRILDLNIANFKDQFVSKILALYYPEQVLFMFQTFEKRMFLAALTGQFVLDEDRATDFELLNNKLIEYKENSPIFKDWDLVKFMEFLYRGLGRFNIWMYSALRLKEDWSKLFEERFIGLPWKDYGDLKQYQSKGIFNDEVVKRGQNYKLTNYLWNFSNEAKKGDLVVIYDAPNYLAIGRVAGDYYFSEGHEEFPYFHRRNLGYIINLEHTVATVQQRLYKDSRFVLLEEFQDIKNIIEKSGKTLVELKFGENNSILDTEIKNQTQDAPKKTYTLEDLQKETYFKIDFLKDLKTLIKNKKQVILYGPPGTGKTFVAERLAKYFAQEESKVKLIQFHPSYCYEEFMEGLRPVTYKKDGKTELEYRIVNGIFKRICEEANQTDQPYVLIIDEINRGNIPKIFGELLYLLEYRGKTVELPYSKEPFTIPPNLYLIGTMNTSDRSIAALDFALRRRFFFIPLFPDDHPEVLKGWLAANCPDFIWLAEKYIKLNALIEDDHIKIGYSYFMINDLSNEKLDLIWRYNVVPLLKEYFYNDPSYLKEFQQVWSKDDLEEVAATVPEEGLDGNQD